MFENVTDLLREAVACKAIPGAAVIIGCRQETLFEHCIGTLSYNAYSPCVTPSTLYDMASVTKILATTILCLQAVGRGRLHLLDKVGFFLPDAPDDKKDITLLQLLTHSSGFEPHFYICDYTAHPEHTTRVILQRPLAYHPGSEVRYSCMGFILLGKILEVIEHKKIDELFRERVAVPIGLQDTGYCPERRLDAAPTEVDENGQFLQGVVHDENARFQLGVSANAGIFSTLNDMKVFAQALACNGVAPNGTSLIGSACLVKAIQNYTANKAENRGLGFKLYGGDANFMGDLWPVESFGHTGFTGPSLCIDPVSGLFMLVLTNRVHPTRANATWLRTRRLLHNAVAAQVLCDSRGRI